MSDEHNFITRLHMAIELGWLPKGAYSTDIFHRGWCPFLEDDEAKCTCDCIIKLETADGTVYRVGENGEQMGLQ